eukprot:jgi/Psemu1/7166/gm1.7166_g
MGIAPSSNHGLNYSTLKEQARLLLQLVRLGLMLKISFGLDHRQTQQHLRTQQQQLNVAESHRQIDFPTVKIMASQNDDLDLFSEKRFRETRLRQSIVSIDNTALLMEMRNARPHSVTPRSHDAVDSAPKSSSDSPAWRNRVWNNISVSPGQLRNILPRKKGRGEAIIIEEEDDLDNDGNSNNEDPGITLENLDIETRKGDKESETTADKSRSSTNSPMDSTVPSQASNSRHQDSLSHPQSSLPLPVETSPQATASNNNAWYTELGELSKLEHRHEKAYHDTLDERHEATAVNMLRTTSHQHHPNNRRFLHWPRRGQARDGLDFSRDLLLANRQDSIYAMADSVRHLSSTEYDDNDRDDCDGDDTNREGGNSNNNNNNNNRESSAGRADRVKENKSTENDTARHGNSLS